MDEALKEALKESRPDYGQLIPELINTLVERRWAVLPDFFSPTLVAALRQELHQHARQDHLHPARIGKGEQETRRKEIRGDAILWLDGSTPDQRCVLDILEMLKQGLNRELFLGLDSLECHFAVYPPGTGYQKHLDSFQNNNYRRVTVVTYLNDDWQPAHGGELAIYDRDDALLAMVAPRAGTLVCFMSEDFPHAVLPTAIERLSIAGWFRVREPV